ncbi:hypothetical protein QYE76_009155 [Lolium multiflorum]|uniref:Uncharacterized protein n=1 Tax=Lolium multiflorum TaxID=4521 RepID=A0AAD8TUQ6_LOLMU|nr:hypothetical protein QYE76_009155 [Lolium multiflorum]
MPSARGHHLPPCFLFGQKVTFLIGPEVLSHFFRAPTFEISRGDLFEFTVPMFGREVGYGVDRGTRDEQLHIFVEALKPSKLRSNVEPMLREVKATKGAQTLAFLDPLLRPPHAPSSAQAVRAKPRAVVLLGSGGSAAVRVYGQRNGRQAGDGAAAWRRGSEVARDKALSSQSWALGAHLGLGGPGSGAARSRRGGRKTVKI